MAGYWEVTNYRSFDVGPDDRRFLLVRWKDRAGAEEVPMRVVVENWLEEVKRIMRGGSR